MRSAALIAVTLFSCLMAGVAMAVMPWWGIVVASGVWGTGLAVLSFMLGWGAALRMPRKDVMQLLQPSVLKRFDELTTRMMMAVATVVGDRVIHEAFPVKVSADYLKAAEKRAFEIAGEEVAKMRESVQESIEEGMPM